jgi:hypothetical protein
MPPNFPDQDHPLPPRMSPRRLKALGKRLHTVSGMAEFLDQCFGAGGWAYDEQCAVWVAPDRRHTGPGRAFFVVTLGGDWRSVVIPEGAVS